MSLEARQLSYAYGPVQALSNVSAVAPSGRITAVLGPNAAGKSTLLRCAIGSLRPARRGGAVMIDGRAAHRLGTRELARRIAYVPQRAVVAASFTVRQVVELGRYALPPSPARVQQAMQRLEVEDLADRRYPTLSVGQQQRVTLARAVAQLAPDGHLILDEPWSGMDLKHVHQCAHLLRELAAGGASVLLATHDLALAAAIVDRVWLLQAGRLVESGPVDQVLTLERLEAVFGARFEWVTDRRARRVLLCSVGEFVPPAAGDL